MARPNWFPSLVVLLQILSVAIAEEPALVIFPDSAHVIKKIGENLVLSCSPVVPDANSVTDLRWIGPDGQLIPNGDRISAEGDMTGVNLFIKGLQNADNGRYTCAATYASTTPLEKTVNLTTIVGITWEDAPEVQSATFGQSYKVRCVVRASPAAGVDWRKDNAPLVSGPNYIIENDGVTINKVGIEDDTFFTCRARVQSTGELQDRRIKVDVIIPPTFVDEPKDTSVVEGSSVRLSCEATGKPTPTYKWVDRNNQDLVGRERFIIDELKGQLTINDVKRTDAGAVTCFVENSAGKISKTVNLHVILKPAVYELLNVTQVNGDMATLTCKATGDPLPQITFLKEGSLAPYVGVHDDRIAVDSVVEGDHVTGTLTIRDLTRSDDGLYACIATNIGGNATKNGHVTVEFPPTLANTPMREAWSWDGHLVNLTCRPEAIPNATVTWYMNDRNLDTDYNVQVNAFNGESTITVTPVDLSYYSRYKCEAINVHGRDQHYIELREARPPGDLLQVKFLTTTATTITFDFVGPMDNGGLPIEAFAVQYKNNSADLWGDAATKQRVWAVGQQTNDQFPHDLTPAIPHSETPYILEDLEPLMTYTFRFAVKNQVGYSQWSAPEEYRMPKIAAPEEPVFIARMINKVVSSSYHDSYELLWKIPNDNGAHIERFQVIYYPVRNDTREGLVSDGGKITTNLDDPTTVKLNLKGLKASTLYRVELRAYNEIGYSLPAEILVRTAKSRSDAADAADARGATSTPQEELAAGSAGRGATVVIVGIIVALLFIIAIAVDVSCYFVNKTGLTYIICGKCKSEASNRDSLMEDGKEETNEKTPLKDDQEETKSKEEKTADGDHASLTINDDKTELVKEPENGAKRSSSKSSVANSPV